MGHLGSSFSFDLNYDFFQSFPPPFCNRHICLACVVVVFCVLVSATLPNSDKSIFFFKETPLYEGGVRERLVAEKVPYVVNSLMSGIIEGGV